MVKGKVFLVGAGPGDKDLITVKGLECIKKADVLIYDRLVNKRIINLAKENAELIYVGKQNTEGGSIQEKINNLLVEKSLEGKNVVRLKGGDPFLFGRGGEELVSLINNNIDFEIVPGVTSAISVPAYCGIPVTHRDISSELHIFTGHKKDKNLNLNFKNIAKLDGTLVFLMGVENLQIIVKELINNGKNKNTPIGVIENGTTSKQRIVTGTLNDILEKITEEKIKPPSITIIGDVVNLSKNFQWFNKNKLSGLKILVTRNKEQAIDFSQKLSDLGAGCFEYPFIDIKEKIFKIENFSKYSIIIFNSANAVRFFFNKIEDIRVLSNIKIGVVGEGTLIELAKLKIKADFIPYKFTVNEALKESIKFSKDGDSILIVTSNISPVDIIQNSKIYNRNFEKVEVYETIKLKRSKEEIDEIFNEKPDIITFLSSSTVESFFENIGNNYKENLKNIKIASIGPETSKTIKRFGCDVDIEADKYSTQGLIDKIVESYGRKVK